MTLHKTYMSMRWFGNLSPGSYRSAVICEKWNGFANGKC